MPIQKKQMTPEQVNDYTNNINNQRPKMMIFGNEYYEDELSQEVKKQIADLKVVNEELNNQLRLAGIIEIAKKSIEKNIKEILNIR